MFNTSKILICIVGPTAVGKTSLSIDLANEFNSEIVSCDSRQFYKELEIGTAKPSLKELSSVKHHFINNLSIKDEYNVMKFEKEAINKIHELHENNDVVIMVGGSGMFFKAVCEGFDDIPAVDSNLREELNLELEKFGIEKLQSELKELDSVHYGNMDIQNSQRLIRALEICRGTGKPYSSFRIGEKKQRNFRIIKIGLDMEREELYNRIDSRMDEMLELGLLNEVKFLKEYEKHNALQTVGYKEIFSFLNNEYDWEECVRLLKRNSRRYAKRQLTWFRRDDEVNWFPISVKTKEVDFKRIYDFVKSKI